MVSTRGTRPRLATLNAEQLAARADRLRAATNARSRRRRERNPKAVAFDMRDRNLRANYNITAAQWEHLHESQNRRCACCGATEPGSRLGWATDHDHDEERNGALVVRGILCQRCNHLLGACGDNVESVLRTAERLVRYLREQPARTLVALSKYAGSVERL